MERTEKSGNQLSDLWWRNIRYRDSLEVSRRLIIYFYTLEEKSVTYSDCFGTNHFHG